MRASVKWRLTEREGPREVEAHGAQGSPRSGGPLGPVLSVLEQHIMCTGAATMAWDIFGVHLLPGWQCCGRTRDGNPMGALPG